MPAEKNPLVESIAQTNPAHLSAVRELEEAQMRLRQLMRQRADLQEKLRRVNASLDRLDRFQARTLEASDYLRVRESLLSSAENGTSEGFVEYACGHPIFGKENIFARIEIISGLQSELDTTYDPDLNRMLRDLRIMLDARHLELNRKRGLLSSAELSPTDSPDWGMVEIYQHEVEQLEMEISRLGQAIERTKKTLKTERGPLEERLSRLKKELEEDILALEAYRQIDLSLDEYREVDCAIGRLFSQIGELEVLDIPALKRNVDFELGLARVNAEREFAEKKSQTDVVRCAISFGDVNHLRELIDSLSDKSAISGRVGLALLFSAIDSGNLAIVRLLVEELNLDHRTKSTSGINAVQYAKSKGQKEIHAYLRELSRSMQSTFELFCRFDFSAVARRMGKGLRADKQSTDQGKLKRTS